jgi:hypothetical protein
MGMGFEGKLGIPCRYISLDVLLLGEARGVHVA